MSVDELYSLRNMYWCGNYPEAIKEGLEIELENKNLEDEKRLYLIRSYIGNNEPTKAIELISDQETNENIKAIAFLAMYSIRPDILTNIMQEVTQAQNDSNVPMLQLVAANLYHITGNIKSAAEVLSTPYSTEAKGFLLQIYLELNKLDNAKKILDDMIKLDEDSSLTHIAHCYYLLAEKGSKLKDILYITQDLMDKFGSTPYLLNIQASCHMVLEQYDEAYEILSKCHEENPQQVNILANLISCLCHLNKPFEFILEYIK